MCYGSYMMIKSGVSSMVEHQVVALGDSSSSLVRHSKYLSAGGHTDAGVKQAWPLGETSFF